jgi:hypothetical protein
MRKEYLLIPAAAVVILAIAALFIFQPRLPGTVIDSYEGFTTLSLTQGTSYVSSDPFFNEPAYTLAVVADGSSAGARGTFTPDLVGEFTGNNRPSGPFGIEIQFQNQTCRYTLQSNPLPVYSFSTFQYPCTTSGGAYCTFTRASKSGDIYVIDSVPQYDTQITVTLNTTTNTYSTSLSTANRSGEVAGVMRASYIGALQGTQGCPVPSTTTVLYRPVNTNQLQPKSSSYLSQLTLISNLVSGGYIDGPLYSPGGGYTAGAANDIANQFFGSTGQASAYCPDPVFSGTATTYSCKPVSPVALPLLRLVVKASSLGVTSPSGIPKIISLSSPTAQAGNTTTFTVRIRNDGTEQDSFDLSVAGKAKVNLQAARISLAAGQQQDVPVLIQGAGIIGNYTLTAASVNSPNNKDSISFRLEVEPFCDRPAEPGKTKVATEYGCAWICQGGTDLRERTCQPFGTFEPKGKAYNRTGDPTSTLPSGSYYALNGSFAEPGGDLKDYSGEYHCTGIAQYTTLNGYMDSVLSGTRAPFVAQQAPNAYFVGAPICNYWAAYGYKWNGQQAIWQDEVEFYDVFGNAPVAQQAAFIDPNVTLQMPILQLPAFGQQQGSGGSSTAPAPSQGSMLYLVFGGAILAVVGAFLVIRFFIKKE